MFKNDLKWNMSTFSLFFFILSFMNEGSGWSYTGLVSGAVVKCDINNEFNP